MDPKQAEAIGLLRHSILSPVLMETAANQMAYFRRISAKEFDIPGRGMRRFTPTTMKGWLRRYRRSGFAGLVPKTRSDAGKIRALDGETKEKIKQLREDHLDQSVVKFHVRCVREGLLGDPPICLETLRRFLKSENLYRPRETKARKRFEMARFGELWTCDFMHGPQVLIEEGAKRRRRSILLAIIDDHSRMIVGWRFGLNEDTKLIEPVFKDAILGFGLPDRLYCDNGAAFSSTYLSRVCAVLNIGLVHSKPYDSPSRGKIERFFRTVRTRFLADHERAMEDSPWSLERLNQAFGTWLREDYHHGTHRGIQGLRPIDRYQISIREAPRRRVDEESIDEFFLVSVSRTVNRDCTVSLHGTYYEVPSKYIGHRVELKYAQEHPTEIYLYDNGIRIQKCVPVDSVLNGKSLYQPQSRISDVALHEIADREGGAK